jgi:hypothetical protein
MVRYSNAAVLVGATLQGAFAQGMFVSFLEHLKLSTKFELESNEQHRKWH